MWDGCIAFFNIEIIKGLLTTDTHDLARLSNEIVGVMLQCYAAWLHVPQYSRIMFDVDLGRGIFLQNIIDFFWIESQQLSGTE